MRTLSPALPLALVAAAALLSGCVVTEPGVVPPYQTQRLQRMQEATVVAVRPVVIDGSQSGAGSAIGAVTGSIAGANIGGYRDGFVGSIVGFVAGAVVGNAIERSATRTNGQELTLQMKSGEQRLIVQGLGNEVFQVGERVGVVSDGYRARVTHLAPGTAVAAPAPVAPGQPAPVYSPQRNGAATASDNPNAPVYTPR